MGHCDLCNSLQDLWHNESTGLALCESCDLRQNEIDADPDLYEAERQRRVIEAWLDPAQIPALR